MLLCSSVKSQLIILSCGEKNVNRFVKGLKTGKNGKTPGKKYNKGASAPVLFDGWNATGEERSEEKSSPEEDPVSFFSLLDKDGAEQWYRADCYERYRILGFYQSVSTADGFHYVLGSRGWEVEEGRYAASSVLVRMDDRGEDLRYFPIPEMGVRTAKFCFLQIDGMGRACLVGALEARDNLDRWYILPIHASLFTDAW
jgi:hypothetical protein